MKIATVISAFVLALGTIGFIGVQPVAAEESTPSSVEAQQKYQNLLRELIQILTQQLAELQRQYAILYGDGESRIEQEEREEEEEREERDNDRDEDEDRDNDEDEDRDEDEDEDDGENSAREEAADAINDAEQEIKEVREEAEHEENPVVRAQGLAALAIASGLLEDAGELYEDERWADAEAKGIQAENQAHVAGNYF